MLDDAIEDEDVFAGGESEDGCDEEEQEIRGVRIRGVFSDDPSPRQLGTMPVCVYCHTLSKCSNYCTVNVIAAEGLEAVMNTTNTCMEDLGKQYILITCLCA